MALPKVDETVYDNVVALAEQRAARIEALEAALLAIEALYLNAISPDYKTNAGAARIARAALDKDARRC